MYMVPTCNWDLFLFSFKITYVHIFNYLLFMGGRHLNYIIFVEVRGQHVRDISLLLPHESKGLRSGHQD